MSWRSLPGWVVVLVVAGCGQVEADHPLDPDTPTSKQHKARISGALVYPTVDGLPPDDTAAGDARVQLFPGEKSASAEFEVRIDASGNFRFDAVDPGVYRMHVVAPGYVTDDRILSTSALLDFDVGRVVLRAAGGGVVLGVVTGRARLQGADNHAGTLVTAGDTGRVAVTDYDGRFALDVPPGAYTLLVRHDGYAAREVEVEVDGDGTELDAQVLLEPIPATVTGDVTLRRFSTGPRVAAVVVTLQGATGEPMVDGPLFDFDALAPGTWTLSAEAEGYETFLETTTLGPGDALEVPIELLHVSTGAGAVTLAGTVAPSDGAAPGGTRVEIRADPWDVVFASVVADTDGGFTLPAAPDERYMLHVEREGYDALAAGPFAYDAEDARFEDEDGAPVSLTLEP